MATAKKFGTFSGVFTPSVLTILGVIMYLRLPWIVGQGGLAVTIGIILVAHVISITTGLSVSSIATDKKVKAGGTYYMISRSLGLPIGGTLGLALFVGLSFSVSLYVIGFSESFLSFWDLTVSKDTIRITGTITLVTVTTVTFISTALALKTQFFILSAIGLSLLSIVLGSHDLGPTVDTAAVAVAPAVPFIVLFGIFFPAVTGFEAGVSMSGDLADPKKSIPVGTIAAIVVGVVVYLALAMFLARTVSVDALRTNPRVLFDIALFAPLVVAGIWGATISSAFGSILGAPRILQATAADRITPRFFARGHGRENEPRRAMMLTFAIAEAGIMIGELDVIARVVSMFFITAYGFLNLSAAIESWASPDFRPDFRVPTAIPILGAIACFVVMIQLDFLAMIGSTLALGTIYLYLTRKQLTLETGDTWEGVWSSVARAALRRLTTGVQHRRNWRPNILQFGSPQKAPHLVELGHTLAAKRGVLTNVEIVPSATELPRRASPSTPPPELEGASGVFFRTVEHPDHYEGIATVASLYGFSGVDPNTVMLGWPEDADTDDRYRSLLRRLAALDHNLLLVRTDATQGFRDQARVDVWWAGGDRNIGLAIALIRFLTTSDDWPLSEVRFLVANNGDPSFNETIARSVRVLLDQQRVEGTIRVITNGLERRPIEELMAEESRAADLTIVGLPDRFDGANALHGPARIVAVLGPTLLIRASTFFEEVTVIPATRTASRAMPSGCAPSPTERTTPASAITLPEAAELAGAVTNLEHTLRGVSDEIVARFLGPTTTEYAGLVDQVTEAIDTTFTNLREGTTHQDRHKALRSVGRIHSNFLFNARQILGEFIAERLVVQQERMSELVPWLRRELSRIVQELPERIRLPRDGSRPGDRPLTLLRSKRVVRIRRQVRSVLPHRLYTAALDAVHIENRAARTALDGLLQLLRSVSDGIAAVEQEAASGSGDLVAERIATGRARTLRVSQTIRDSITGTDDETTALVREHTDAVIATIAHRVDGRAPPPRSARGPGRRRLHDQLRVAEELCQGWSDTRTLEVNRAMLVVWLASLRERLETIVTRGRHDLLLEMDNGFIGPLHDMASAVRAALDTGSEETKPPGIVHDGKRQFAGGDIIDHVLQEIETAIEDLPDEIAVQARDIGPEEDTVTTLPLRGTVQFQIEVEFAAPLRDEATRTAPHFDAAANVAEDVVRLTRFHFHPAAETGGEGDDGAGDDPTAVIHSAVERLDDARNDLEVRREELAAFLERRLRAAADELHLTAVHRAAAQLRRHTRERKGREVVSRLVDTYRRIVAVLRRRLVRLQYRGSEGILLARRLGLSGRRSADGVTRLRDFIDSVLPSPPVLDQLPSYYRQLFLGKPTIPQGATASRRAELNEADELLARHAERAAGALAVIGAARSGRTTLAAMIARRVADRGQIFRLNPPRGGTCNPDVFRQTLGATVGVDGGPAAAFRRLGRDSVLIVDDVERWWERTEDGGAVIEMLVELIGRYGQDTLLIVTGGDRGFSFIDRLYGLQEHLLGVIGCRPFDAEDLKEAVLTRHESTGLTFTVDDIAETALSEWAIARLFTAFFRYTGGGVGDTLHAWISHIDRADGSTIMLRKPELPDTEALDLLRPIQVALIVQWILHRRLTRQRLERVTGLESALLRRELDILLRAGLVVERGGGAIELNPFVEPHLIRRFSERHHV